MPQKKGTFYVPEEQLISIVEGMKRGDKDALAELYTVFDGYLSRYVGSKVPSKKVEELVADTLYIAHKTIYQLRTPAALPRWLISIAHSRIYHFYKDVERERRLEEKARKKVEQEKLREIRCMAGIDLSKLDIKEAVHALPEKQKEAVLLRSQGFKVSEIAEIQGVSDGTVKSRLNYARKKVNAYAEAKKEEHIKPDDSSV